MEYNLETLSHIYDSLNCEIEKLTNDLVELRKSRFELNPNDAAAHEHLETLIERAQSRLDHLDDMRFDIEYCIGKCLKQALKETE